MKTIKIILITVLMCALNLSAIGQSQKNGTIVYEVIPKPFNTRVLLKNNNINDNFDKMHGMHYELAFNQNEALYLKVNYNDATGKVSEDKNIGSSSEVKTFGYYQRTTYTDLANNTILNYLKDGRAIKYSVSKTDWVLTDETKVIEGYVCHKATKESEVKVSIISDRQNPLSGDSKRKFVTTVWFTKEIPNKIGPAIYAGFPGLVLEVDSNLHKIKAKKIELDLDLQKISKPKHSEVISYQEYKANNLRKRL